MNEGTRALCNAPSRKIFSPLFRARWQNMQNIVNDTVFETMVPEPYKTYYLAYIRQWLQWSRGFVPMLHRGDFFSLGMGYTVCDIYATECMTGGFTFQSADDNAKSFVENWAGEDFSDTLGSMFFHASAGGNCILALTPCNNELYVTAYPVNRVIFQIGRKNTITKATILNRFTAGETAYYARELRIMMDGEPYYRVQLAKGTLVTSPSWTTSAIHFIPEEIAEQWKNAYGDIEPGVWYKFPKLHGLGLYNIRNKSFAVALADLPGYSDSSLHTALDVLYSIDYNYTQGQIDQYLGKGRGLVPKQMGIAGATKPTVDGGTFAEAVYGDARQPLDEMFYDQMPSQTVEGDVIKPIFMQADLRGEQRKFIRDADLEVLASKVGLSSSTLANHLNYNQSKTATQYEGEQDTTEKSVMRKRRLAGEEINKMLSDVLYFYDVPGTVTIQWGAARVNSSTENAELLQEYQAGALTLKQYLRRRWKELSETEVEDMAAEIEAERAEQQQFTEESFLRYQNDNSKPTAELASDSFGGSGNTNSEGDER